tara:strand:- start:420 stop:542 length:123 start_codon:yes stop_codon:yes gene_type:complete
MQINKDFTYLDPMGKQAVDAPVKKCVIMINNNEENDYEKS